MLLDRLVTRRYEPNEKLSLQALADEIGVSRSPVHHALTRLVTEGLVSVRPRRGYFVTPLTPKVVCDAYDVRYGLEVVAAEKTVAHLDVPRLATLRELMEATLPNVEGGSFVDKHGYIVANQRFHEYQVDLAGNPVLSEMYRRLSVNLLMERILRGLHPPAGNVA